MNIASSSNVARTTKSPFSTLLATLLFFLPPACAWGLEAPASPRPGSPTKIRVALYCDQGSLKGAVQIEKCLKVQPERFQWKRVTAEEIRQGALREYDVVVQGGGSGSRQAKTLEPAGRDELRKFVENGGGYLGICAGAYLATADYDWSLHVLNAKVVDRKHWTRGAGQVKLRVTPAGEELLGIHNPSIQCRYHQGPLLAPGAEAGLPAYTVLTNFASEIAEKGAPKGVMIGTTAMACGKFGKGRVFVSSPHPEATPGLDGIIRTAVVWLARQDSVKRR